MRARAFLVLAALTTFTGSARADDGDARTVEVRDSVRKHIGGCTYTAYVSGHYQTGAAAGSVRDAVVDVTSQLACEHHPTITSQQGIYFASTTATALSVRLGEAATVEYSPRAGRRCLVEPAFRAESNGPVIADLAMTCFAEPPTTPAR